MNSADYPLGTCLTLWIILSLLLSASFLVDGRVRPQIDYGNVPDDIRVPMLVSFLLVFPAANLVVALASWGILHVLGHIVPFVQVWMLLLTSGIPACLAWPMRLLCYLGRTAYRVWQAIFILLLATTTVWMCVGMYTALRLSWWEVALACLPPVGVFWWSAIGRLKAAPDALVAVYPWCRMDGEKVVVFYPPSKDWKQAVPVAQTCDLILEDVCHKLEVDPLPFKVYVFLFPEKELLHRLLDPKTKSGGGYALGDCIALVDGDWGSIAGTVAHEFGHVLWMRQVSRSTPALLNEGIAMYAESEVAGRTSKNAHPTVPVPLRFLAHNDIFYDWQTATETETSIQDYYEHAHSFVRYLITLGGLDKLKQLCAELEIKSEEKPGEHFARSIRKVYEMPLWTLEYEWRQKCGCAKPMWRQG